VTLSFFVRHDLGEGDAGVVVDTDMDELPADAASAALAFMLAGYVVSGGDVHSVLLGTLTFWQHQLSRFGPSGQSVESSHLVPTFTVPCSM